MLQKTNSNDDLGEIESKIDVWYFQVFEYIVIVSSRSRFYFENSTEKSGRITFSRKISAEITARYLAMLVVTAAHPAQVGLGSRPQPPVTSHPLQSVNQRN